MRRLIFSLIKLVILVKKMEWKIPEILSQKMTKYLWVYLIMIIGIVNIEWVLGSECKTAEAIFNGVSIYPTNLGTEGSKLCPFNTTVANPRQTCCSDATYTNIANYWAGLNSGNQPDGAVFQNLPNHIYQIKGNYDQIVIAYNTKLVSNVRTAISQDYTDSQISSECQTAKEALTALSLDSPTNILTEYQELSKLCAIEDINQRRSFLCAVCDYESQQYMTMDVVDPTTNGFKIQSKSCDWIATNCSWFYRLMMEQIIPYINNAFKQSYCWSSIGGVVTTNVSSSQYIIKTDSQYDTAAFEKCARSVDCQTVCKASMYFTTVNTIAWVDITKLTLMVTRINNVFGANTASRLRVLEEIEETEISEDTSQEIVEKDEENCEYEFLDENGQKSMKNDVACNLKKLGENIGEELNLKPQVSLLKTDRKLAMTAAETTYIQQKIDQKEAATSGSTVLTFFVPRTFVDWTQANYKALAIPLRDFLEGNTFESLDYDKNILGLFAKLLIYSYINITFLCYCYINI